MTKHEIEMLREVARRAKLYIDECNCPAPDFSYRRTLRDQLEYAIDLLPKELL